MNFYEVLNAKTIGNFMNKPIFSQCHVYYAVKKILSEIFPINFSYEKESSN